MGKPFDIKKRNGVTYFRLPNKDFLVCKMNTEDFNRLVSKTKCWYIHKTKTKARDIFYIRRTKNYKQCHLHREVLGLGDFHHHSVVDHDDRSGLNNCRDNLIHTDTQGNMSTRVNTSRIKHRGCSVTKRSAVRGKSGKTYTDYVARQKSSYVGCATTLEVIFKKIDDYIKDKAPN